MQVIGMEDLDEGPMITPDELDLLERTLSKRLEALARSEAQDEHATSGTRAGHVAAYRNGQRRVLRAAIAELEAMRAAAGAGGDEE